MGDDLLYSNATTFGGQKLDNQANLNRTISCDDLNFGASLISEILVLVLCYYPEEPCSYPTLAPILGIECHR